MADYYINQTGSDGTAGTEANPWRTFVGNASGNYFLQPGDNVYFHATSVWVGRDAQIYIRSSGTSVNRITLGPYGGAGYPTLIGDSATTEGWQSTGISSIYVLTNYNPTSIYVLTQQDTMALCRWRGQTNNLVEGTFITTLGTLSVRLWGGSDPSVSTIRIGSFRVGTVENRGLLFANSMSSYVTVNSMKVMCVNGVGITASGSSHLGRGQSLCSSCGSRRRAGTDCHAARRASSGTGSLY